MRGIPTDCLNDDGSVSEEPVTVFISCYLDRKGIKLECKKLIKNPGLQTIAKAILNLLWGKYSQNENNSMVKFVEDYQQLLNYSNNTQYNLTRLDFVTEDCVRIMLSQKDDFVTLQEQVM